MSNNGRRYTPPIASSLLPRIVGCWEVLIYNKLLVEKNEEKKIFFYVIINKKGHQKEDKKCLGEKKIIGQKN